MKVTVDNYEFNGQDTIIKSQHVAEIKEFLKYDNYDFICIKDVFENVRENATIEFSNEIIIKNFDLEAKLNDIIVITNTADLPLLYVIKESDDRNKFYNDIVLTNNKNDLIIENKFLELLDNNGQVKVSNPTSNALQSTNFTNVKSCVNNIFKKGGNDTNRTLGSSIQKNQKFVIKLNVHNGSQDMINLFIVKKKRETNYYEELETEIDKVSNSYGNLKIYTIYNWIDYIYLFCITCIDGAYYSQGTSTRLVKLIDYLTGRTFELNNILKTGGPSALTTNHISGPSNDFKNLIIYGIPGCGKSYKLKKEYLVKFNKDNIFRTTFYPDYTNSDFVGQIRPVKDNNGNMEYKVIPGPFLKALEKAYETKDKVALVIEEINRGNAAAIFGDIFQLLDRDNNGDSEYSIENEIISSYLEAQNRQLPDDGIKIPNNLYIYATMNTSDQNVFKLDTAFKRRWEFIRLTNESTKKQLTDFTAFTVEGIEVYWETFLNWINKKISNNEEISGDRQIGNFFYDNNNNSQERFANKVLEYLYNDVCKYSGKEDIFKDQYKTFDEIYDAFVKGKNVFKDDLMEEVKSSNKNKAKPSNGTSSGTSNNGQIDDQKQDSSNEVNSETDHQGNPETEPDSKEVQESSSSSTKKVEQNDSATEE